ncbi:NarK/NasA family nitrate transporter [Fodinisporobacter ferrooxydans]|uniref:NarK/NasA family nitrate transporter n=1 Tax=Fodinisporobacter ferrooxydans TaxID=2901836 RepID=A0ABY4CNJ6_9BACL|nr:NarK/NasA family nitrate transporter [Alicyclobacillaceae bacterium MYW30-H2]
MTKQKGATSVLVISTLAMVVAFTCWAAISPLAVLLQKTYHLSATQKSILVAIPVLLGSVMRIPLGMATDRFGGRKVYSLLMLFLVIPAIGLANAHSYMAYVGWAFLLGMAGTSFAVGIASVSKWYPPNEQGLVLGITGMGNIGTAVAGFALPTIAKTSGISSAFWALVAPVVIAAVAIFLFTKDPVVSKKAQPASQQFAVMKNKMVWVLSLFYFVTFGGFVAFGNYLPSLLVDVFKITPIDAGMRAAGFVVLATLVRPIGGYLADKFGASKMLSLIFILLSACALILSVALSNIIAMTIACLLTAALVGIGNGTVFKLVPQYFPTTTGIVTGIVGAAGGIGGFFPPIVMGIIKDATGGYALGFVFLLVFTFSCLLVNGKLRRSAPNNIKMSSAS